MYPKSLPDLPKTDVEHEDSGLPNRDFTVILIAKRQKRQKKPS
jgi:hypothetical protein